MSFCPWHATLVLYENGLTYHHIFSPYGSTTILVLPASNVLRLYEIPTGLPPAGALNRGGGGVWKCRNFRPIIAISLSEMVEGRWVCRHAANRVSFDQHWILFPTMYKLTFMAIVPGAYTRHRRRCRVCFFLLGMLKHTHMWSRVC